MPTSLAKALEKAGKRQLTRCLLALSPRRRASPADPDRVRKILVFRLDRRIGNGILLLPLLRAIRASRPDGEIHLLIHRPVAELVDEAAGGLVDRIWPYHQASLMKRPWGFPLLVENLRRERFDAVLTCHNPDNFSLSQAVAGRLMRPGRLIGFDWKDNARFYDLAVPSSADKPYAEAMLDLWRAVDPAAIRVPGALTVPAPRVERVAREVPAAAKGGVLIWLGATGGKGIPEEALDYLERRIREHGDPPVQYAAGPADADRVSRYPRRVAEKTLIWRRPLVDTAAFLSRFRLFVSGDTGPMHLAAALGLPTLTVFLGSSAKQYGYGGEETHLSLVWKGDPGDGEALTAFLKRVLVAAPPGRPLYSHPTPGNTPRRRSP